VIDAIAIVWLVAGGISLAIFWPHYEGVGRKTLLIMWSLGGGPLSLGILWLVHWAAKVETFQEDESEECSNCGTEYSLTDYRADAPLWSCSQCHAMLPRQ
jgi:hypothetical protein